MPIPARYEHIDDRFQKGGMSHARVYNDTHLERQVVIKTLTVDANPKRLLDEIRALQSIRSKHVVQIYDIFRADDGSVGGIIEELVSGSQFGDGPAPTDAYSFMKLIHPLAKGISDIHEAGIVHRDIKPSNIKFDQEGCLKIFDFGLARDAMTDAHTVGAVGSIGYMAPELYYDDAGGHVYFTNAVDVYAFGATALFGVLRKLPRELTRQPPQLPCTDADFSKIPLALPADVAGILNACISENARDRPEISAVVGVLERYLLFGRHRALLTHAGQAYTLDRSNRKVSLTVAGRGAIDLNYNDLDIVANNVSGHVYINNIPAQNGSQIPGSCVIALGDPNGPGRRAFITVDVSHPEVTI